MERIRCLVLDLEGNAKEITQKLNEAIEAIEAEGGQVLDVRPSFTREHGIDGFVVLYTVIYKAEKSLETE